MSRSPPSFLVLLTRLRTSEMCAPTYAILSQIDPNEAYERLESAFANNRLLMRVQDATWAAIGQVDAGAEEVKLLDRLRKKNSKNKRFRPATVRRSDEGAWVAVGLTIGMAAGVASGEAASLLDTDDGQRLAEQGFALLGSHLAKELLR